MLLRTEINKLYSFSRALVVVFMLLLPLTFLSAQTNATLPVAIAVAVLGASPSGGQVVVSDPDNRFYSLSRSVDDGNVYGITVAAPPLLFASATNTTAVVTSGSAYVRFTTLAGIIERGDLLVTSSEVGVAQKATADDEHVFAVALQNSSESNNGQILVQFDPVLAKAMHAEEIEAAESALAAGTVGTDGNEATETEEESGIIQKLFETYARGAVAAVIAIGALFFVMYTFRSTIVNATQAVGRNPRARNAIMTVSIGNIIFAMLICALAIFVALAILVLPV